MTDAVSSQILQGKNSKMLVKPPLLDLYAENVDRPVETDREKQIKNDRSKRQDNYTDILEAIDEGIAEILPAWLVESLNKSVQDKERFKRETGQNETTKSIVESVAQNPPLFLPQILEQILKKPAKVKRQTGPQLPPGLQQLFGNVDANMILGTYQAMVMPMSSVGNASTIFLSPIIQGIQGLIPTG